MKRLFIGAGIIFLSLMLSVNTMIFAKNTVVHVDSKMDGAGAYQVQIKRKIIQRNGVTMVPVREVGEILGFEIQWNSNNTVTLTDGQVEATVKMGLDRYQTSPSFDTGETLGLTPPFALGAAPEIYNGSVYVPVQLFYHLLDEDAFIINGQVIWVTTNQMISDDNRRIENPLTEHKTVEEMRKAVHFNFKEPLLPDAERYSIDVIQDIDSKIAEIQYSNGDNIVVYRVSKGDEDNSGDYEVYEVEKAVLVDGIEVTYRGNGKGITFHLAIWTHDGFSYSIHSEKGLTETQLERIVKNIAQ